MKIIWFHAKFNIKSFKGSNTTKRQFFSWYLSKIWGNINIEDTKFWFVNFFSSKQFQRLATIISNYFSYKLRKTKEKDGKLTLKFRICVNSRISNAVGKMQLWIKTDVDGCLIFYREKNCQTPGNGFTKRSSFFNLIIMMYSSSFYIIFLDIFL